MEGKSWDHRQLAKADGTRTGWAASISHSVSPVHIALVCVSVCVLCARIFFFFLRVRLSLILVNYLDFVLNFLCLGHKMSYVWSL